MKPVKGGQGPVWAVAPLIIIIIIIIILFTCQNLKLHIISKIKKNGRPE
jgi:hypothetical protein